MGLKDLFKKAVQKDERFKEMQREIQMQRVIEERQKSSNERELDRFLEEKREAQIKEELERFRKEKQEQFWHGNNILHEKNIFKGQDNILKQKNIFTGGNNHFLREKNMFFN